MRGKLACPVREGADGKGPEPRAPRRRPTSLGGGPSGKGPAKLEPRPTAYPAIVTDPYVLVRLTVSDDEAVVEVPARLMAHLAKDGLAGGVVNHEPPIVPVKENGNLIIQGIRVTDPDALAEMDVPGHEICVEVSKARMKVLVEGR